MSAETLSVGVTVIGVTVGVQVAKAFIPFLSSRTTVTAGAVPIKLGSGTKVTLPSAATVYVPTRQQSWYLNRRQMLLEQRRSQAHGYRLQ